MVRMLSLHCSEKRTNNPMFLSVGHSFYASQSGHTSWTSYLAIALAMSMSILLMIVLFTPEFDFRATIILLFWMSLVVSMAYHLYKNASQLVNLPKLRPIK